MVAPLLFWSGSNFPLPRLNRRPDLSRGIESWFHKLGGEPGKRANQIGVTRICPSQSGPEPMPMVAKGNRSVISLATGGVTSSSTTANAPASASACRVVQQFRMARRRSRPLTRYCRLPRAQCWGNIPRWPRNGMPAPHDGPDLRQNVPAALGLDGTLRRRRRAGARFSAQRRVS